MVSESELVVVGWRVRPRLPDCEPEEQDPVRHLETPDAALVVHAQARGDSAAAAAVQRGEVEARGPEELAQAYGRPRAARPVRYQQACQVLRAAVAVAHDVGVAVFAVGLPTVISGRTSGVQVW